MKAPFKITSLFSICILFSSFTVKAQQQVEVSGQVKDEQTKESLPYCDVMILNAKDSIIQGGITDDKGYFRLPITPGQYSIVISAFGYQTDTLAPDVYREDRFLGVFKLNSNMENLGEVEVKSSARIDKLDKDVQIVTEELKMGTTATKEVLNKIAGISFDEYAQTLKVDNDANIMVLVNGVEKSQEYIQNIDPERLIRVETIRDPGGRYGLEGYTAIINVILRRDYTGTEVYLEQFNLIDIDPMDYMIGRFGATYNYTRNDLNVYGSANIERKNFKLFSSAITSYDDGFEVVEESGAGNPNTEILQLNANYTLGLDYRFNPKHAISIESYTQAFPLTQDNTNIGYNTFQYMNDTLQEAYRFDSDIDKSTFNSYNSLFYIGDFSERTKLNVNFTYSNYRDDYTNLTTQEGYYVREEVGIDKKQYTRGYAELDHMLNDKASIQFGYGNTWRELNNAFTATTTDSFTGTFGTASDFTLTDMRHKLYSNFSYKINDKWSTRAGMALETSAPKTAESQVNYMVYQPLFDLRFTPGKMLNMTFKYRTYPGYPSIAQINPFTSLVNPRITQTGNPLLGPQNFHRFSLRTNIAQGLLSLEPYTTYSNNMIAKVGELDATGMFNTKFENAELFHRYGVRANFNKMVRFTKTMLILQSNAEAMHTKIISSTKENSLMAWRGEANVFLMSLKSQAMFGVKYQRHQMAHINALGYDKGDVDFWMLLFKKPVLKNKGSLMFCYFLPLDLATNYDQGSLAEAPGITMQTNNDVTLVKNMFLVEFSYRFSKGKRIKKTEKEIEKEQEESGGGVF